MEKSRHQAETPLSEGLLDLGEKGREPGGQRRLLCRAQGKRERTGGRKVVDVPPCSSECGPRTSCSYTTRELVSKAEGLCLVKVEKWGLEYPLEWQDRKDLARLWLRAQMPCHTAWGRTRHRMVQPGTLSSLSGVKELWIRPQLDLCSGSSPL